MTTNEIIAASVMATLRKNRYGLTLNALAFETGIPRGDINLVLKGLVATREVVSNKVARNPTMYGIPNSCEWSTRAAVSA